MPAISEGWSYDQGLLAFQLKKPHLKKVRWTDHMGKILIDCYLAELDDNVGADNGLKIQQWNSLRAKFAVDAGVPLIKSQLQNEHADLKKKWGAYSDFLKQSGFGWNA